MTFGERLAHLRKENNLSQYELAEQLKLTRGQIANYEQGTREPDFSILKLFSNFFGVSTDYLLTGNEWKVKEEEQTYNHEKIASEAEFINYVREHIDGAFFYNFKEAPDENKQQLISDLKYLWERDQKKNEKKKSKEKEIEKW